MPYHSMRNRGRKRSFRPRGNSVIHVPSTIAGSLAANTAFAFIIASPSIFAGGSASSNIEAQDKDRTVNVGHHIGRLNISVSIRNTAGDGVMEFAVMKVERQDSTPSLGTFPIPSTANINGAGMMQAVRMRNPGKTFHSSKRPYSIEMTVVHNIIVSPAKYKLSKFKAGDHWVLMMYNRGPQAITYDFEARYKEYE